MRLPSSSKNTATRAWLARAGVEAVGRVVKFCKTNGFDPGTQRQFGQSMDRGGYADHKGGKGVRYRKGLALHEIEDDSAEAF
jgi:hypothetical protein